MNDRRNYLFVAVTGWLSALAMLAAMVYACATVQVHEQQYQCTVSHVQTDGGGVTLDCSNQHGQQGQSSAAEGSIPVSIPADLLKNHKGAGATGEPVSWHERHYRALLN